MDSFVYQCKKQITKLWNEVPFPEVTHNSHNSKAMASRKSATKRTKDLCRHSNKLMNRPDKWLLLQVVCLHECTSSVLQWSHHNHIFRNFQWLTVDSAILLCVWKSFSFVAVLVYYLSTPCAQNCWLNHPWFS